MLSLNWHRLPTLLLWISPHAVLGVLAVVLCKRRSYRKYPAFFAYALYETANFILLFALAYSYRVTARQYMYVYYATLMISVALRFGVIDEVSRDLFRESQVLKLSARRALQGVTALLVAVGVLLAIFAPGDNSVRWIAGVSVVNRGAALVQSGLLLSLLLCSRFLGVSWRRAPFGITLGLGILTCVDFAIYALRAGFNSSAWVPYLDLLRTGTYLICISIWILYVLAPEPKSASNVLIPQNAIPNDEVDTWNREFRHLLR